MADHEIRVAAQTSPPSLAASLVHSVFELDSDLVLVAIGVQAVSNAIKAVALANRMTASRGFLLAVVPGMENRDVNGEDWVVTVLRVTKKD